MDLFAYLRDEVIAVVKKILSDCLSFDRITCEPPRDSSHGDVATNAAMVLAKGTGLAPRALAEKIIEGMAEHPYIEKADVAGPGFINFTLKSSFWIERLKDILKDPTHYGESTLGKNRRVNIEYVSANPTGPIHMGHTRGAVAGDVLANIYERVGYQVTREYYINDAGGQADQLARSLYSRYCEILGKAYEGPAAYRGEYLIPVAQELAERDQEKWVGLPEEKWLASFRQFAVSEMMTLIRDDLALLSIHQEVFTSEKELVEQGKVEKTIDHLDRLGLLYRGILAPPKGKPLEDWEPREQLLFKSSQFGDDTDRPLQKSDGSWTYFTPDIAYHYDKFQRGADLLIDVLGADHAGYIKRITSAVKAVTQGKADIKVLTCQLVKFIEGGRELKMSKRAGTFVTVREAIRKVGKDAIRFMMVWRKNDTPMDFDFQAVVEQSKENPVFYVQYAHARCHSVMRHVRDVFPDMDLSPASLLPLPLAGLANEDNLNLIRLLVSWPRQLALAAEHAEPHRISYFLYEVASAFHALWNKGKENAELRFIFPDQEAHTKERLALVAATAILLKSGLSMLGVTPLEEMR